MAARKKKAKKASKAAKAKRAPKAKKTAKKAAKPIAKKAKKTAKKSVKAVAKKAPAKKAKRATKPIGEGDYAASRRFLMDEVSFVENNKASIPAMGREAERALEGPEGAMLRDAEATAAARSRDIF